MKRSVKEFLLRAARGVAHLAPVKPRFLHNRKSVISFTFDDVRLSACEVGRDILASHGVRGTFYVCMGLRDSTSHGDPWWSRAGLERVLSGGHEVGCHTFSHRHLRGCSRDEILGELDRNAAELKREFGIARLESFAYPFGSLDLRVKRLMAERFVSARSSRSGVHSDWADFSELRAVPIGPDDVQKERCLALIGKARRSRQWLIFYTHDVKEGQTAVGCSPGAFAEVVRCAVESDCAVLPIHEAVSFTSRLGH